MDIAGAPTPSASCWRTSSRVRIRRPAAPARSAGRLIGSDLDAGVVFASNDFDPGYLASLQVALEDLFAPLRVDLVPLQRVDALFQFEAIDGHRVLATDDIAADEYELLVMRRAAELLPIQHWLETECFGVSKA